MKGRLLAVAITGLAACSASGASRESPVNENVANVASAITPSDPISTAVDDTGCSTTIVKGLSLQLIDAINCLKPNTLAPIDMIGGLDLGPAVFPFLEPPAVEGLTAAAAEMVKAGKSTGVQSVLRTLPQQYLLYQWYLKGTCDITLAAKPGTSNHESGLALDIDQYDEWRASMEAHGFKWHGSSDVVHFDFIGGGTVNLAGLSVTAYQKLWNTNNPSDVIPETGTFDAATEARLLKTPSGGFAKGVECTVKPPPAPTPTATASAAPEPTADPDAGDTAAPAGDGGSDGCSTSGRTGGTGGAALMVLALVLARAARRRVRSWV